MRIAIFGAGAVGCYLGGRLAAAGGSVLLIGRARIGTEIAQGLTVTDYRGGRAQVGALPFAEGPEAANEADLVLVCVKSAASAEAAQALRPCLAPDAVVVSFQNGLRNAQTLAEGLGRPVLPGMVGFNVAAQGEGRFHQGTQGDLHVARDPRLPAALFARAGLALRQHGDMPAVLRAKLMLNLNNAINALSGVPLQAELSQRDYRRCLALAQEEWLTLTARAGQPLARLTPLPASMLPRVLRLPDSLFRRLAGGMLRIDPLARSSMADDLALGRQTEIDWINGEVVRLAESLGRDAPVNRRLMGLIRAGRRIWPASALLTELSAARRPA
ncbi:MAG: 2-dehydropantoate 2-reductase [Rhodobacteraceae bacterium]|nr:2-dehydropantoate 2-reductase [Paracoccaceae bacterium]